MTEPEPEPQPDDENVQLWQTAIHVEAEVIPGEPADPEED